MRDNFNNHSSAFAHRSTKELKQLVRLFWLLSNPRISKIGVQLLKHFGHIQLPGLQHLQRWLFHPFYAGTSLQACESTVVSLSNSGVHSYLNYAVEDISTDSEFDTNCEMVQKLIVHASKTNDIPFSVCKPTSFGHKHLFQKINAKQSLNLEEQIAWKKVINRFRSCCQIAQEHGVALLVDAEEYSMQIATDQLVLDLMREFNLNKAVVYNTVQLYLVDGNHRLKQMHMQAIQQSFYLGVKLVRGAYMEKECKIAHKHGLSSPICTSKSETDMSFNAAVDYCIKHLTNIAVVLGSHNEESMIQAINLMDQYEIKRNDDRIWFSQLLGMSDYISFILANEGYNVVKFVPFGPMDKLIPYLARRAEENSAIAGQTTRELVQLQNELKRRTRLANER
ncbi:MAG: proline dehydrogenase family protein [Flavobacteriaceae bacterium]|nr:proline dehydrogenase family protein [Flavobacteriaceae bacterium]